MSFASPQLLLGLLLLPMAVAAYLVLQRRRKRYAVRFTNLDLLANIVRESPGWRRHVPAVLAFGALAALLVGVARPELHRPVPRQASVLLALDVSGSMSATDIAPSRFAAARRAAAAFVDRVPRNVRVGLIAFSNGADLKVPPTTDHAAVKTGIAALRVGGATAMGDAIALATNVDGSDSQLASAHSGGTASSSTTLVLLSDGSPSPGTLDPLEAARQAKAAGVRIYTVALGTKRGVLHTTDQFGQAQTFPVPPDPKTLSRISKETGGTFFSAPSTDALDAIYGHLGHALATDIRLREITAWFAAGAVLLLLVGGGLSAAWFGRIP